mmetsp:Transcript_20344/g.63081  ORF Transcript_20344/g.63081 Transcript_20344/m.63081 type:complete len:214 (-) Transcript_20344:35-676(-)
MRAAQRDQLRGGRLPSEHPGASPRARHDARVAVGGPTHPRLAVAHVRHRRRGHVGPIGALHAVLQRRRGVGVAARRRRPRTHARLHARGRRARAQLVQPGRVPALHWQRRDGVGADQNLARARHSPARPGCRLRDPRGQVRFPQRVYHAGGGCARADAQGVRLGRRAERAGGHALRLDRPRGLGDGARHPGTQTPPQRPEKRLLARSSLVAAP